jgi:uncharacterized protein with PIN domain
MAAGILTLILDEDLLTLMPRPYRTRERVAYALTRRASIKDIIEALHVPHTEVRSIVQREGELPFSHIPEGGETLLLHAFLPGTDVTRPSLLRPDPLPEAAFAVDINAGKLAKLLRMSGFDTLYDPQWRETELLDQAIAGRRILLSRNRDLLKRKCVDWGHLVRAEQPVEQLREILVLYGLQDAVHPFSRCLECNTLLKPVPKSAILHRLEPLTRKYYRTFHTCPDCDRIYWQGSHRSHMKGVLENLGDRKNGRKE